MKHFDKVNRVGEDACAIQSMNQQNDRLADYMLFNTYERVFHPRINARSSQISQQKIICVFVTGTVSFRLVRWIRTLLSV